MSVSPFSSADSSCSSSDSSTSSSYETGVVTPSSSDRKVSRLPKIFSPMTPPDQSSLVVSSMEETPDLYDREESFSAKRRFFHLIDEASDEDEDEDEDDEDNPASSSERRMALLFGGVSDDEFHSPNSSKKRTQREFKDAGSLRPKTRLRGRSAVVPPVLTGEISSLESPPPSFSFNRTQTQRRRYITGINRSGPPEWAKKQAMIAFEYFMFNGKNYKLEAIGSGTFHKAFKFVEEGSLKLGEHVLPLSEIILKTLMGTVGPNKKVATVQDDHQGYLKLMAEGVPVVDVYAEPMSVVDPSNPKHGMFWIIEKMEEQITGDPWKAIESFDKLDAKSKKVLQFAKYWLTRMAVEKRDIIFDFRKRNTMMTGETIKIVDYGCGDGDESDVPYMIGRYVDDWANGNRAIFDWLISDFPEDMKPLFDEDKQR